MNFLTIRILKKILNFLTTNPHDHYYKRYVYINNFKETKSHNTLETTPAGTSREVPASSSSSSTPKTAALNDNILIISIDVYYNLYHKTSVIKCSKFMPSSLIIIIMYLTQTQAKSCDDYNYNKI